MLILILVFRAKASFGKNQSSFTIKPGRDITKIELSEGDKRLLLARDGEKWLVNGRYEARKSGLVFITGILTGMKMKSPVSSELFEKEITEKGIAPVRVKVYEGVRPLKKFFVYKTASNKYGNIMKMRERSRPFIVWLPGFEGDIGSGFILNELFWKPFTVFSLLPSEISSITLENMTDTSSSFEISSSDNGYCLSDTKNKLSGWDTSRIKRYVSYFSHIPFEKWVLDMTEAGKKQIEREVPHYAISVIRTDGVVIKLLLWDRLEKGDEATDSDRLWGKTDDIDDFFIIRYLDIDPIIKKRSYFFGQ